MQKNSPSIFVVVLNFNGKDTLIPCLSSIYHSDYPSFEVVVVDNNSNDGSFENAKTQFSRSHFIRNSKNIGFSCGNNVGIRFALEKFADYILVLNNDALLEKDTLSKLQSSAESNAIPAVINPLILNGDGRSVWFSGGKINWPKMKTLHLTQRPKSSTTYNTEYCTGCAMFISKEIFKKIGLFDERYFLYYEDADFSVRAARAGFELKICPTAKVKHFEQSSELNELKTYWLVLSGMLFFLTQSSIPQKIWLFFYVQLRKIKNIYSLFFKKDPLAPQVRQAYKDFRKI